MSTLKKLVLTSRIGSMDDSQPSTAVENNNSSLRKLVLSSKMASSIPAPDLEDHSDEITTITTNSSSNNNNDNNAGGRESLKKLVFASRKSLAGDGISSDSTGDNSDLRKLVLTSRRISLSDQIFNFFTGKRLALNVLSANLESVLPADGGYLAPDAVPIVARRIDLLTALSVQCPNALRYSKTDGHDASLLHYAVRDGNKEIIRFLLEQQRGVDLINTRDAKYGASPLHWATSVEAVEMLVDAGCDQDAKSEITGESPLHIAIRYNRNDVAAALIELGSELNVQSLLRPSLTALHLAISLRKPDWHLIAVLLGYGANPNIKDANGDSPRHIVAKRIAQNNGCIKRLRKILSLLHHVGASRCPLNKTGCAPGCSAAGAYDGEPVEGYTSNDLVTSTVPSALEMLAIFDDNGNNNDCQSTVGTKVLCLDGGAMHGILTVMLLKQLEAVSNKTIKDCFDVIAGAGIGGVLALYLTYLEKEGLPRAQKLFYFLRRKVFAGSAMYTAAVMEGHFKRTFGIDATLHGKPGPKVIIPCYQADCVIRNYQTSPTDKDVFGENSGEESSLVYKAANETGVVDELFRSGTILLRNNGNPSLDVLTELSEVSMRDLSFPKKTLFISLGTTSVPLIDSCTDSFADSGTGAVDECDNPPPEEKGYRRNSSHGQLLKMSDPYRPVDQARAWCRDSSCTYSRLAPKIRTNLSVENLQFESETSDTVARAVFELRAWLARNNGVITKVASTII